MSRLGRTLFFFVAAIALGLVIGSTACTRRGGNGVIPSPSPTPVMTYYVNPATGKDTNSGTAGSPFKTIGKALKVASGSKSPTGVTITLAPGAYTTASGEVFPLVVPSGVSISLAGNGYGRTVAKGTYINGYGEDTFLEKALSSKPPRKFYATLVVPGGIALTLDKVYIGTTKVPPVGYYASVDVLGSLSASSDTFAIGARSSTIGGIVVPSGTLTCFGCFVLGPDYAIKAFTAPSATSGPSLTLSGPGHSVIAGGDGIRTDGSAMITASSQVFQSRNSAYTDSLALPSTSPSASPTGSPSPSPTASAPYGGGSVDFGYGAQNSLGGNTFVGSKTEINVTIGGYRVSARNNTWNVIVRGPQHTNAAGQYPKTRVFGAGADGQNVRIAGNAVGGTVVVGPPTPPTATPSPTPYGSATPSPTASPT
jgi:hypothetical protein